MKSKLKHVMQSFPRTEKKPHLNPNRLGKGVYFPRRAIKPTAVRANKRNLERIMVLEDISSECSEKFGLKKRYRVVPAATSRNRTR
jgi:hypothetical protein